MVVIPAKLVSSISKRISTSKPFEGKSQLDNNTLMNQDHGSQTGNIVKETSRDLSRNYERETFRFSGLLGC